MKMKADRIRNQAVVAFSFRQAALAAANGLDRAITALCRFVLLVTGIALTVVMTGSVAARYLFASGGFDAAQELPERLFPWFIVAGAALGAQAGGHMSVEWLLGKVGAVRGRWVLLIGDAIVIGSYLLLSVTALEVAEIAKLEQSPVLNLPGSHGYWAVALGCVLLALATLCSSVRVALAGTQHRYSIEYKEL
jgi:TRAP-type C4-dicarboxylate transport system permease small subunit